MRNPIPAAVLFLAASTFAFGGETANGTTPSTSPIRAYSQKTLLMNWALADCLTRVAQDPRDRDDAHASAGAYLEFGRQPMEAYEALDRLVQSFAKRKYGSASGSALNTMKCIDLFHSRELGALAEKWAGGR